jgi:hypothetical protein
VGTVERQRLVMASGIPIRESGLTIRIHYRFLHRERVTRLWSPENLYFG